MALFVNESNEKQRDQLRGCPWSHSYPLVKSEFELKLLDTKALGSYPVPCTDGCSVVLLGVFGKQTVTRIQETRALKERLFHFLRATQ